VTALLVVVAVLLGAACAAPSRMTHIPPPAAPSRSEVLTARPSAPPESLAIDAPDTAATHTAAPSTPARQPEPWIGLEPGGGLPVGELPADLTDTPTQPSIPDPAHRDDDDAAVAGGPGGVAARWTVTRAASRFDDAASERGHRLGGLAAHPSVAAAADLTATQADPAHSGATWAIITDVAELGEGWWRVTYTLKQTRHGQLGPTSTPATLDVHVNPAGLVDAERP
jgi:hypothetical protein